MNTDTGKLYNFSKEDELKFRELLNGGNMVEVDQKDMTEKQKLEMQVSKFDNNSKLGKMFHGTRKERRKQERDFLKSNKNGKK